MDAVGSNVDCFEFMFIYVPGHIPGLKILNFRLRLILLQRKLRETCVWVLRGLPTRSKDQQSALCIETILPLCSIVATTPSYSYDVSKHKSSF